MAWEVFVIGSPYTATTVANNAKEYDYRAEQNLRFLNI